VTLRKWILAVLAVSFAALSISLGFWQLRRLDARKQRNSLLAGRRTAPEVELGALPPDTALAHFRRVHVDGKYDYAHEIVLTLRMRDGSPGVHLITPVRRAGTDSAVLVNRGWVYSPDGVSLETAKWNEGDSVNGNGFVETFPTAGTFDAPNPERPRSFRRLHRAELVRLFPYPIANYYVVLTDSSAARSAPARAEAAALDEGPHRGYAIQWFSFAAISIIGLGIFLRRS
jgi:surfeit locus 1 family protein